MANAQIQPRPYQEEALDAILGAYRRGVKSALAVLATGSGKTNIFVWLIQRLREKGMKAPALILVHREELLQQAAGRIIQLAPELRIGIERGSETAPVNSNVVVATVQSLARQSVGRERLNWFRPGLIIIDECHHSTATGYRSTMKRYRGDDCLLLGVTATAKRHDRIGLMADCKGLFEEQVYSYPITRGITEKWLCDIRGYRVQTKTDLSKVKTHLGDFAAGQLAKAVDAIDRTGMAISRWEEVAKDRRTIAFGVNVEHAHHIAEEFQRRGYVAEAVDGTMEMEKRNAIMRRARSGQTQILTNVEIATEGVDMPEMSCALMLRPTQSWGLYMQCLGRILRPAPGKEDAIVIDVVDNCARHSLASAPAILDLPPGLDLQGKSLKKASDRLREIGAKAAALKNLEPRSFEEIESVLQNVNLLANLDPASELKTARLGWLALHGGSYFLSCGGDKSAAGEQREARIEPDALGNFTMTLTRRYWRDGQPDREVVGQIKLGPDLGATLQNGEAQLQKVWTDVRAIADRNARWRSGPVSVEQSRLLRRLGQPDSVIAQLDRGKASSLISQLLASRPERPGRCA